MKTKDILIGTAFGIALVVACDEGSKSVAEDVATAAKQGIVQALNVLFDSSKTDFASSNVQGVLEEADTRISENKTRTLTNASKISELKEAQSVVLGVLDAEGRVLGVYKDSGYWWNMGVQENIPYADVYSMSEGDLRYDDGFVKNKITNLAEEPKYFESDDCTGEGLYLVTFSKGADVPSYGRYNILNERLYGETKQLEVVQMITENRQNYHEKGAYGSWLMSTTTYYNGEYVYEEVCSPYYGENTNAHGWTAALVRAHSIDEPIIGVTYPYPTPFSVEFVPVDEIP